MAGEGETVDLPQIGRTKKTWVYAGGALVAGIVGYAWWKHRAAAAAPAFDPNAIDPATGMSYAAEAAGGATTHNPAPTGNGNVNVNGTDPTAINTVAQWTQLAVQLLQGVNVAQDASTAAIGKWLGHQGLTGAEKLIIMEARAIAGDPPISPVPPMLDALPTPGGGTGGAIAPPTNVHVTQATLTGGTIVWNPVPDADHYQIDQISPGQETQQVSGNSWTKTNAAWHGYPHVFTVRTVSRSGAMSTPVSVTLITAGTRQPGVPPTPGTVHTTQ